MSRAASVVLIVVGIALAAAVVLVLHLRHGAGRRLAHARTQFSFTLDATKQQAFPLFGASGERRWGTNSSGAAWEPQFLWPQPERDAEGEVFLIAHGHHGHAVWLNTAFDEAAGHAQYAVFVPGALVMRIDVRLTEMAPGLTRVDVIYDQTALDAQANPRIERAAQRGPQMAQEWQQQVAAALQK